MGIILFLNIWNDLVFWHSKSYSPPGFTCKLCFKLPFFPYLLACQAAVVPEETSDIQERFNNFKSLVAQFKDILDRAIASTPDIQQLQTP